MPTAAIGRWEFFVPDGWELKDVGIDVSYIQAPDGTKGIYSKTVRSEPPKSIPRDFADYIQQVHRGGFDADPEADWTVMEHSGSEDGDLYRSRIDLWDQGASYRVLSVVLCSTDYAVQLTMHDYLCSDYESARQAFSAIENSLRLVAGAA